MKEIHSFTELKENLHSNSRLFLLLYKKGSSGSDCAYNSLSELYKKEPFDNIYCADVTTVKDIHSNYGIQSAPSLLIFNNEVLKNVVKGCQDSSFYSSILTETVTTNKQVNENKKPFKHVLVYTTPTCSWCNTLKNYLRTNRIVFKEIDVASDTKMAEQMVKKSGQQGVPQIEINGRIIVGFNRDKIDELLDIN